MLILFFSIIILAPIHAQDNNDTAIPDNSSAKTYMDLYNQINDTSDEVLNLNESYKYNSSLDGNLNDGVVISKNISIVGHNNASIDGSGLVRLITVESNCRVILENLTFINGFSNDNGGGIFLKANSSLILRNCIFKNNTVYNSNGGAIYACKYTDIEIHGSTFTDNTAIRESDLVWEEFKKGMGSAICQSIGSNLKIYDSIIKNNIAYLSTVLLISYNDVTYDLSKLFIKNSLFENNTSFSSGVVYLDELGKGEIIDSVFRYNNITNHSGVLVLDASLYALVQNCSFENNYATNGGVMHIKLYEQSPANVSIVDCNFTNNVAKQQGGAIYSNRGIVEIINSRFENNTCSGNGGAIIATKGSITTINSSFINNSANRGGALYLTCEDICLDSTSFTNNIASDYGGAVYSKTENVTCLNCSYINNKASKGNDVYGIFDIELNVLSSYFNDVDLEIKVTSPWKVSINQSIKIKFNGEKNYTTSWLKIGSNGELKLKVPFNLNAGTYSLKISSDAGVCTLNQSKIQIDRLPCKLTAKKLTTTYESGKIFKIYLKDSKTKNPVKGIKLKLKVYTGKKYKSYTLKTDKNGLIKFDTSQLDAGNHKIIISSSNTNVKLSNVTTHVKVKKATAKMSHPKSVKKSSKIKIKIKNKASGIAIKKNMFKVKVGTGKESKTYNLKTSSKGIIKVPTKGLKKGKYKVTVELKNKNYNIYKKFTVKIKK